MSNVTNLNKARKALTRLKKKAQSQENAVKFGLTKAQKTLEKARSEKAARDLDGKQRDE